MKEKKNLITLEVDSALALMQEIYNDIVEQKNYASMIMKKMLSFMKDQEDMSMIGPVIKEQQKIMNECTEKKISLVKLQGLLLKQTQGAGGKSMPMGKLNLTEEERELLDKLVDDKDDKTQSNANYKL
jgi:hypothetical protein